ncbi:hypothetical protein [Microbacterium murale]|uniref:Uncharacterized protein n=1 Tax=Microbacterium murale TaxID=1081040 RepID=A0ABQ1RMI1_9MICO|nr:hypothetical protein [Microbacterium murale]GGD74879.1 hypothetical protein GCM10007269_17410 [Microbacterium murale]
MSDEASGEPAELPAGHDAFDGILWPDAAVDADPTGANIFTAEIENVNSSDWEVDPDVIWGDDPGAAADVDGGTLGPDFLV